MCTQVSASIPSNECIAIKGRVYTILKQIGSGGSSKVRCCISLSDVVIHLHSGIYYKYVYCGYLILFDWPEKKKPEKKKLQGQAYTFSHGCK